MLPKAMTSRVSSGKSSASRVYGPFNAGQRASQSPIDSAVQNDQSTQMNQKVAKVQATLAALLTEDSMSALAEAALRPCLISHSEFSTTRTPSSAQNSMSCQTNNQLPRSQNHW
jgi:hypothetical protein